jgi:hypothetical protein
MIRVVHPGPWIRMLTFSHPGSRIQGSKKAPNPGSRIRIRNTDFFKYCISRAFARMQIVELSLS